MKNPLTFMEKRSLVFAIFMAIIWVLWPRPSCYFDWELDHFIFGEVGVWYFSVFLKFFFSYFVLADFHFPCFPFWLIFVTILCLYQFYAGIWCCGQGFQLIFPK
jgi:hypothetical protein